MELIRSARLNRPIKDGYNADLLKFATAVTMHGDTQQIRLVGPGGEYQGEISRGRPDIVLVSNLAWGILRLAQHLKQVR